MNAPLAFVDTETTGVHPGRRAWEVAIIRREPDGTEDVALIQVADVDLSHADPFGLRVGRFYERHLAYAPASSTDARTVADAPDSYFITEFEASLIVERMTRGAHLVGAVPNFDAEVFADMLRRHQLTPAWHYHLIDVEALAVGYINGRLTEARMHQPDVRMPRWEDGLGLPWRSDDLSMACGVVPAGDDERHTALGDAKWAMRLYDAIVGGAE